MSIKDIISLENKYESFGQSDNSRMLKQTGKKPNIIRDKGRKAKLPGKRISKNGKIYWETRSNRSDTAFGDV